MLISIRTNQQTNQSTLGSPIKKNLSGVGLSHSRYNQKNLPLHVLSISAPVTRIRWRPPEDRNGSQSANNCDDVKSSDYEHDYHESMIAVATSSIAGVNAGGNGSVGLWSYHRSFMPISVVEGHRDGAVTDFGWVDRPYSQCLASERLNSVQQTESLPRKEGSDAGSHNPARGSSPSVNSSESPSYRYSKTRRVKETLEDKTDSTVHRYAAEEKKSEDDASPRTWQKILTVGRDGQCLLQNFSFGEMYYFPPFFAMFASSS